MGRVFLDFVYNYIDCIGFHFPIKIYINRKKIMYGTKKYKDTFRMLLMQTAYDINVPVFQVAMLIMANFFSTLYARQ